jgi:hypothetical protein
MAKLKKLPSFKLTVAEDPEETIKKAEALLTKNAKAVKGKTMTKAQKRSYKASRKNIQSIIAKMRIASSLNATVRGLETTSVGSTLADVKTVKIAGDTFSIGMQGINANTAQGAVQLERLYFDTLGATEIINISRHYNISTPNAPYQPIADIAKISQEYDPNRIVVLQKTASEYFNNFPISFDQYQPVYGTGPNNEIVYVESGTGDLVVNMLQLDSGLKVEVQVLSFQDLLDATIYEETF